MAREPGYCLHKPSGEAYVRFNGKPCYLGEYGSEEGKERYNRLKAEWLVNRHAQRFTLKASGPTMAQVALAYLDHAEAYYKAGSEYTNLKLALNPISELYATLPACDFGVVQFPSVRDWWLSKLSEQGVKRGTKPKRADPDKPRKRLSRQYINKQDEALAAGDQVGSWRGHDTAGHSRSFALRCAAQARPH